MTERDFRKLAEVEVSKYCISDVEVKEVLIDEYTEMLMGLASIPYLRPILTIVH